MQRIVWTAVIAALAALCFEPASAQKAFPAPSGWDHVSQTASPDNAQTAEVYQNGSGDLKEMVTIFSDSTTPYDQAVDRIHHNITQTKMKVNVDKDQSCDGKTARNVEMVYGPEGKRLLVDRLVVPDGSGTVQITYTRPEAAPFDAGVKTALTTYCGA